MKKVAAFLTVSALSYGVFAANSTDAVLPDWFDKIEGIQQVNLYVSETKQQVRVYWDKQMEYSGPKELENAEKAPIAPSTEPSSQVSRKLTQEEFDSFNTTVRSKEFFMLPMCPDEEKTPIFQITAEYRTPTARLGVRKCCLANAACPPMLEELKKTMFKYPEKNQ